MAVIEVTFDPFLRLGDLAIAWRTVGVAGAILAALLLAAALAGRTAATDRSRADPSADHAPQAIGLRRDDLLFVAIGIIPGAVLGGRWVHGLAFLEHYQLDPLALFDPARGSLSLLGAVLGGTASGAYVATLLDGVFRRWAWVAAAPLLLAIGLGKLAQLLAGAGQGLAFDGPWAVAFLGTGPWLAPSPEAAAHPSQAYEGLWALVGVLVVLAVGRGRGGTVGGWLLGFALGWWLVGRFLAAFTWRDDQVVGPLNAEQVGALVTLILLLAAALLRGLLSARRSPTPTPVA
ncbi:MAG: prolipoprotein diacylglyceryl transferase [Chloroflexi bacterium]|nr:prolipoprotein diacylglyceryl transferase [Chloroflexota bacterium]